MLQASSNGIHRRRQRNGSSSHRLLGAAIVLAEQLHQGCRLQLVKVFTQGIGLLGEQMAPAP